MKKLIALFLVLALTLSLTACSLGGESKPAVDPAEQKIAEYVEKNKEALLAGMEASFATSSGMTCTSSIKAEGRGFVIQLNINELEDVPEEDKALLQSIYDGMGENFKSSLKTMQTEIPEIEYYKVLVCEKDGDVLATIEAKN